MTTSDPSRTGDCRRVARLCARVFASLTLVISLAIIPGAGAAPPVNLDLNPGLDFAWSVWDGLSLDAWRTELGQIRSSDVTGPLLDPPATPAGRVWTYTLLPDSRLTDDCPICDRLPIVRRLRGTFQLRLVEESPLYSTFAVENISLATEATDPPTYKVAGQGTYQVGGSIGRWQKLFLDLAVDDGHTNQPGYLANSVDLVDRWWPMINIHVDQTNGTELRTYRLDLAAAPLHELWFSVTHDFHAGIWQSPTNYVSAGDLLSSAGRMVKSNGDLTRHMGIMPIVPDVGLDAVEVLPGGEIAFSIERDIFSETLGPLHEGDVLSDQGRVVHGYTELIGVFGPEPPPTDQGVDAVHVLDSGELYFSIERDFFSERLGRQIRHGDLLSSLGQVVKTNDKLLARFNPADPKTDYGLDAIYVWPSGEVWFSTESGFAGAHFDSYPAGWLLSDQGYVVYRNLELMAAFRPLEKLGDFGLDALFVITDSVTTLTPPKFVSIEPDLASGTCRLRWVGKGRVFQLDRASEVMGPYRPVSPIMTDGLFEDVGVLKQQPRAYYRVGQW